MAVNSDMANELENHIKCDENIASKLEKRNEEFVSSQMKPQSQRSATLLIAPMSNPPSYEPLLHRQPVLKHELSTHLLKTVSSKESFNYTPAKLGMPLYG